MYPQLKLLFAIAFLISVTGCSQTVIKPDVSKTTEFLESPIISDTLNELKSTIKFSPYQVYSSAIIEFDFENKGIYLLNIVSQKDTTNINVIQLEKEFSPAIKKIDLSYLSQGEYVLRVFQDNEVVYQTEFLKK